jgi:shikimate kinase
MSTDTPNLILIGLRASGKSTLGKLLAQHLGRDFIDLDDAVSERMNASGAGEAIERDGIDAFRANEYETLKTLLSQRDAERVIALGGGTPTAAGVPELLLDGEVLQAIYLRGSPETLRDRLEHADNSDRPALVGEDVLSEVQILFEQRDELYRDIAHSIIHIDGVREESVLQALIALYEAGM